MQASLAAMTKFDLSSFLPQDICKLNIVMGLLCSSVKPHNQIVSTLIHDGVVKEYSFVYRHGT